MACNCTGNVTCGCHFGNGTSTVAVGAGSERDPVRFDVESAYMSVESTATILGSLSGTGDTDDPYRISFAINPVLTNDLWGRWVGSQGQYDAIQVPDPGVIHVVM